MGREGKIEGKKEEEKKKHTHIFLLCFLPVFLPIECVVVGWGSYVAGWFLNVYDCIQIFFIHRFKVYEFHWIPIESTKKKINTQT